ncbi:MAG: aminomethyl-transferring glycine dehydrogenase subunit GcvPA [Candidatus Omnitrophota bacterium]
MPYILNTQKDIQEMLNAIGARSVEELYTQIPAQIKLNGLLDLPAGKSEFEVKKAVTALADKNIAIDKFNSFLGAGCYGHYIPAVVPYILSLPQFLTAYTPYQAECSQGILQAIYEYQSFICLLTGMDVTCASLLDGASAFAEAVLMSLRLTKRKKVFISEFLHPEYKKTLHTYLSGFDFIVQEIKTSDRGFVDRELLKQAIDNDTACFVFANPNFLGLVEDTQDIVNIVKEKKALTVMAVNPLSLALFKEPGLLDIDIVCGDGQPLGGSLSFGGSCFGFLAAKKEYLRQVPGRIAGKAADNEGKSAFCLTLAAREQHIRREKAVSNICSNQSLNTIGAAVYLSLMGSDGLKNAALYSFSNAQYLYQCLKEVKGVSIPYSNHFFNEFIWEVENAAKVVDVLYGQNIIAGYCLGEVIPEHKNSILSCCTEKKTKEDIDNFVTVLKEMLNG